ncbi:CRISPR-associated endonuclease Cas2 [Mycoplasmopsis synoviae]|uniref:CRISPR-associated endonuclease Cas2 n=1 Tax=Mycoplasmopsis synoviae TaxID=2109 RepID=UPI001CE2169C|nr:CRISPR-associated endonuclease Cas2 [Mycoplasmopsis synoviae]UBX98216.1 CRISPR-associated endonuclease Cas2 [Mycoplasmopsis synoviae]
MRIILMYDIYSVDEKNKEYTNFKKHILSFGYFMIQYSVYCKNISVHTQFDSEIKKLSSKIPNRANIRILLLTENQYQNMIILSGEKSLNEIYNERDKYIEL